MYLSLALLLFYILHLGSTVTGRLQFYSQVLVFARPSKYDRPVNVSLYEYVCVGVLVHNIWIVLHESCFNNRSIKEERNLMVVPMFDKLEYKMKSVNTIHRVMKIMRSAELSQTSMKLNGLSLLKLKNRALKQEKISSKVAILPTRGIINKTECEIIVWKRNQHNEKRLMDSELKSYILPVIVKPSTTTISHLTTLNEINPCNYAPGSLLVCNHLLQGVAGVLEGEQKCSSKNGDLYYDLATSPRELDQVIWGLTEDTMRLLVHSETIRIVSFAFPTTLAIVVSAQVL